MNNEVGVWPGVGARCEALESRRLLAAGDQDLTFGGDGSMTLDVPLANTDALVALASGKVLVVGGTALERRNADGTLDASFGASGIATYGRGDPNSQYNEVKAVLRADGKIVVAGSDGSGAFMLRFNSDGSRDVTFGGNGGLLLGAGSQIDDFVIQPDNKIVFWGKPPGVGDESAGIYRLNADGSVDAAFTPFIVPAVQLALQPDGKIVGGGSQLRFSDSSEELDLVRLNPSGAVDTSFGAAGFVANVRVSDLLVTPDSRIVIANGGAALTRLTSTGQIDTTFGTGVTDPYFPSLGEFQIALAGGGSYFVFGNHLVFRTDASGKVDPTFGLVDTTHLPYPRYGGTGYVPRGAAVLPDGSILLAALDTDYSSQLLRVQGSGSTPSRIRIENGTLIVEGTNGDDQFQISGPFNSEQDGPTNVQASLGFGRMFQVGSFQNILVSAGAGNDDVHLSTTMGATVLGGDGDDSVSSDVGGITVSGGNGNDSVGAYTQVACSVSGDAGNDSLSGAAGDDTIRGGDGDDQLGGSDGEDQIFGDNGNDNLDGGIGSDTLHGGAGDDVFESHDDGSIDHVSGDDGVADSGKVDRVDLVDGVESHSDFSVGQLDLTFGDHGTFVVPVPDFVPASVTSAVLDGDYHGYVVGGSGGGADLVKLTDDLKLDKTFGNGGMLNTILTHVHRVVLRNNGRYLVSGYRRRLVTAADPARGLAAQYVNEPFFVYVGADGNIERNVRAAADTRNFKLIPYYGGESVVYWHDNVVYGLNGASITIPPPKGARSIAINDISQGSSTNWVVATATWDGGTTRMIVCKLSPGVDQSFGANGYARPIDVPSSGGQIVEAYLNRLYVSGQRQGKPVVLALNESSGQIDPTWGDGGFFQTELPAGLRLGTKLLRPDYGEDRLLLFGGQVMVRITPEGKLDESFGKVVLDAADPWMPFGQPALAVVDGRVVALNAQSTDAPELIRVENQTLVIDGTEGADNIVVTRDIASGQTVVSFGVYGRVISSASFSSVRIDGRGGSDIINVAGLDIPANISGGEGDDKILGGSANDTIAGDAGADSIDGAAGNDSLSGNGGRDKIAGGDGDDQIFGGASGDFLHGMAGDDQVFGDGGNDRVYGEEGDDLLNGGSGDDVLVSMDQFADQVFGSSGVDHAQRDDRDLLVGVETTQTM